MMIRLKQLVRSAKCVVLSAIAATALGSMAFGATTTLTQDENWTGQESAKLTGTIDLKGHKLTVSALPACTITDSSAVGSGGELHVNVASGATVTTGSVTLSGSLKVVKEGPGALNFSKEKQPFKGGIDVVAGKIYTSAIPGNWPFGGNGTQSKDASIITVNEGAEFAINGKTGFAYVTINLNGGTISGASTQFNAPVNLLADSYFKTTDNTYITWIKICLNGYTLNVTIATGKWLDFTNATIENGIFNVVQGGTLRFYGARNFSTVDFRVKGAIDLKAETSVRDYEWLYPSGEWNYLRDNSAKLKVFGAFTPTTDCFYGCEMQNGSTLNLASKSSAWSTTGTATTGIKSVTFASGATVTIDVGERELHKGDKVVAWSAKPASVVFKITGRNILTDDAAQITNEGVFYTADPDAIVAATWTGKGEDGNITNPENWACTNAVGREAQEVLPSEKTTVTFAGDSLPDIKAGSTFVAAKVVVSDAVLVGDCDWSGLTAPVDGKIDLNGHNLTVSQLAGTCTITDTSAAGSGGELHVNVASGATVNTGSVTLSGSLKVVKEGSGALNFSKERQPFMGGIDVVAGNIYTSASPQYWPFGGNGTQSRDASIITVNEGATFDINGQTGFAYVTINLNGGTISGASTQFNATVNLLADSYFKTTGNTKIPYLKIYLNGFTLNVTITVSTWLDFTDATIENGIFNVVQGGTLRFYGVRNFSTADFRVKGAIDATAETSVRDYEWLYSTGEWNVGSAKLKVFGVFTPTTDCFYGCEMQNGSTLNLASKSSAWSTTGTATKGVKSVTFANGAEITVIPPDRLGKIIAWPSIPTGVTFKLASGIPGHLEVKADGLYLRRGLIIVFQ